MTAVLELVRSEPPSLRVELRERIEHRDALDARHRLAKEIHERANEVKIACTLDVERLKQNLDAVQSDATQRCARSLSAALRANSPLPELPTLPEANSQALTAALARLSALHASTCELSTEANEARAEADAAAVAVDAIVDDIADAEGRELAAEVISAMQAHWKALDRLTGLLRIDEARPSPRLRELQEDVVGQIDRRKLAIAGNPLMIEQMNWRGHLEGISADAERNWQNYRARLRRDPDAQLDVE